MVIRGVHLFHPYAPLVDYIRRLVCRLWVIRFNHILREGNECVDSLVKNGSFSDLSFVVWELCPPQFYSIILADALGVASRLVPGFISSGSCLYF